MAMVGRQLVTRNTMPSSQWEFEENSVHCQQERKPWEANGSLPRSSMAQERRDWSPRDSVNDKELTSKRLTAQFSIKHHSGFCSRWHQTRTMNSNMWTSQTLSSTAICITQS